MHGGVCVEPFSAAGEGGEEVVINPEEWIQLVDVDMAVKDNKRKPFCYFLKLFIDRRDVLLLIDKEDITSFGRRPICRTGKHLVHYRSGSQIGSTYHLRPSVHRSKPSADVDSHQTNTCPAQRFSRSLWPKR